MSTQDISDDPRPSLSDNLPSSFDGSPEFFEEKRLGKLWRRLKEEPLIPIGCAATTYALYQATKSIRAGDHHQTNRMFRARIYAQGFTLLALVAGSIFYRDDRLKRKKFESAVEEKKAAEKREKWLAELDARDKEDREWRERFEAVSQRAKDAESSTRESIERVGSVVKETVEGKFRNKSVLEHVAREGWGPGTWILRTNGAWRRR
jgi:Hypoxia induced protein conserved region